MQAAMLAPDAAKLPARRWATVAPNHEYGQFAVNGSRRSCSPSARTSSSPASSGRHWAGSITGYPVANVRIPANQALVAAYQQRFKASPDGLAPRVGHTVQVTATFAP